MRCKQRADDDCRNNPIAEGQTISGAERLRHDGCDNTESDAAGLCLPKKFDVDLKSHCEHEHQPPKIGEELHDRVVYPVEAENMWPQKEPDDYQPHQFWNSEPACKRLYADDER